MAKPIIFALDETCRSTARSHPSLTLHPASAEGGLITASPSRGISIRSVGFVGKAHRPNQVGHFAIDENLVAPIKRSIWFIAALGF